jgi:hypothetical protein
MRFQSNKKNIYISVSVSVRKLRYDNDNSVYAEKWRSGRNVDVLVDLA